MNKKMIYGLSVVVVTIGMGVIKLASLVIYKIVTTILGVS